MSILPASLPRATDLRRLQEDPLAYLHEARRSFGDIVVLRDEHSIFSRTERCAGSLVVFGKSEIREVLKDINNFGLPESASRRLDLPERLVNFNFSLHGRSGEQHGRHLRLLKRVLNERSVAEQQPFVAAGLEAFAKNLEIGKDFELLTAMRELTLLVSSRLFLGDGALDSYDLGFLLRTYFELRREASSPFRDAGRSSLEMLTEIGLAADDALRGRLREARKNTTASRESMLRVLTGLMLEAGSEFSEDEIVGHLNVLFISSSEPVAIALTWIFLVLSQQPKLRSMLRRDVGSEHDGTQSTLLDRVVKECLRLLPPNALMIRVTQRPSLLAGVEIPDRSEIVICPFLAHRDPRSFPNPNAFMPSRWTDTAPSPFEYFPFGGGGHHCVGAGLAITIIKAALVHLLLRYDFVLSKDQEIDWRIDVQFVPRTEPIMTAYSPDRAIRIQAGRLLGSIHSLIDFSP